MSATRIRVDQLAATVMEGLEDYAKLASEDLKAAVKDAGDTVKKEIQNTAPKDTGAYAKSWAVKTTHESSNAMTVVVHSRNRYQLAHLLEFGHAKRGGGRVAARLHIAAAEQKGARKLEEDVERSLESHG